MTSCIPVAGGVPGLPGPPQWWDTADPPRPHDASLDDPRWRGALRRGYNSGAAEEGIFRALHAIEGGTPVLYLSWNVLHDPSGAPNFDEVHVMFQRPGGPLLRIQVIAYSSLAASYEAQSTAGITVTSTPAGGGPQTTVANPTWLGDTRGWLTLPGGGATSYEWAIAMRVPITAAGPDIDNNGINLGNVAGGSSFNFWYAVVKDMDDFVAAYYWPRTGAQITINDELENVYPTTGLDSVRLGSGAGCGDGIALSALDVGTTNTDPATGLPTPNDFHVSATSPTTNHVFARPTNTGAAVAPNALSASFRTANWGSQADFTFAVGATPWEEILPGTPKRCTAGIPAPDPANPVQQGTIEFDWTISTAEAAQWLPPPQGTGQKWRHQCMLVTLSGPYDFINDSVYRNMDFVPASVFERLAEINVRGLESLPRTKREIYLYVERSNMPRDVDGEPQASPDVKRVITALGRGGEGRSARNEPPERPRPTIEQIASLVPTVRYHVYHETGRRINVNGEVKPVVEEQTSFGHFVQHEGGVYGWDVVLGGAFEKIADNLYRLEVPEGGKTVINTKVHAWEEPPAGERPEIEPAPPQPPDHTPKGCLTIVTDLLARLKRMKLMRQSPRETARGCLTIVTDLLARLRRKK